MWQAGFPACDEIGASNLADYAAFQCKNDKSAGAGPVWVKRRQQGRDKPVGKTGQGMRQNT
jgi:hypothetical protein